MNRIVSFLLGLGMICSIHSCQKFSVSPNTETQTNQSAGVSIYNSFPETFELGTKATYPSADVSFTTGIWNLTDAMIGNTTSDRKNGTKSVRIQNSGILTMKFNSASGASEVRIYHGVYGTETASTWELWYSTNSGSTWIKTGSTITTSSTTISVTSFTMNITGYVRFQVRKLTGGKLNIDDISIIDNLTSTATKDDNLAMGNPSNATTVTSNANNYLLVKSQYSLSYNNSRGSANWVSWHLSTAWKGTAPRCDCFTSDATLPSSFFKATTSNYTNTGFDRGHLCPSEDRDKSDTDNAATFKMTNIIPQAPNLNQITYVALENYCRTLMNSGKELYIISGGYGSGGTGSNGGTTTKIANGSITVPSRIWKIIVVLPVGTNDVARVSTATRVIAVDMPNINTVNAQSWGNYRTTVDAIETSTGYNFLTNVPTTIQNLIEASVDNGPTQ